MDRNRVTVQQAATTLGVTEQAIRKRVKRGSIAFDKDDDGRVYVYLDEVADTSSDDVLNPNSGALISEMRSRIESLERSLESEREANRENRRLLAAALERRGLEAHEASETGARSSAETSEGVQAPETDAGPQSADFDTSQRSDNRPWWRRIFRHNQ